MSQHPAHGNVGLRAARTYSQGSQHAIRANPTAAVFAGAWASARVGSAMYAAAFVGWMLYGLATLPNVQGSTLFNIASIAASGLFWFALLCVFTSLLAVPLVAVFGCSAHYLTRKSAANNAVNFAIGGYAVGASLWLAFLWHPTAGVIFRDWWSAFIIAGPAGAAGGLAFCRRMQHLG